MEINKTRIKELYNSLTHTIETLKKEREFLIKLLEKNNE